MRSILLGALVCLLVPTMAAAQNVGKCGWGSKLMDGQRGLFPQVLAVTTNGTSGNQTFGMTSGTSGCTSDGVVRSDWKTAMFIDANKTKLARDMSKGSGEALESLAQLMGVEESDKPAFYAASQSNFDAIFPSLSVSSEHVMSSLKTVLASNSQLSQYSEVL